MGVQGNTPGKLDRSRSDEGNERSEISERSQLAPWAEVERGQGCVWGQGTGRGRSVCVWAGVYCAQLQVVCERWSGVPTVSSFGQDQSHIFINILL